jgi:hypothetical protein
MALVLAVIGILGVILGLLYLLTANSLPGFMLGRVHSGHHAVRATISILVGLAFVVGALLTSRGRSPASGA